MKITKRQLKRIISEERSKLLNESSSFLGRGAPSPMKSRVDPQFARAIKGRVILEGNASVDYMIGYEDARDDLPMNPTDGNNGYYAMGYADYLDGKHDEYQTLIKDQSDRRSPINESAGIIIEGLEAINNVVGDMLTNGVDPIDLAGELRGLADDVEASSPMLADDNYGSQRLAKRNQLKRRR